MQVWLPALTGAKRNRGKDDAEWMEVEPMRFHTTTIQVTLQGRQYNVRRMHLRHGKCPQCAGWVYEDRPWETGEPRFCSDECSDGYEVRRGLT